MSLSTFATSSNNRCLGEAGDLHGNARSRLLKPDLQPGEPVISAAFPSSSARLDEARRAMTTGPGSSGSRSR